MIARGTNTFLFRLMIITAVALACWMDRPTSAAPLTAKDVPSLQEACEPLTEGGMVSPIPAEAKILALEENERFVCAVAELPAAGEEGAATGARRLIHIKPETWIIDTTSKQSQDKLKWHPGDELTVRGESLSTGTSGEQGKWSRCLQVIQPKKAQSTVAKLKDEQGEFAVTITAADLTCTLELPRPCEGAGWIAFSDKDGKALVQRRPLPAGVLPHGPEGMKLLERWDRFYRDGRIPPWNANQAAPDLRKAVEDGDIKPCRVAVLGCGSGMNSIYLAKKGFEVTAIDVAPTALGIAEADARKENVKVKWLLADVLALPDLGTFDLIFDRGCYHNVRYVDAKGFVASLDQLCRPGTRCFILSCNRDKAPGVREATMREDLSGLFDFEWIRPSNIITGKDGTKRHASWSVMLKRKEEPAASAPAKPNIIYVLVDDMGFGDPSCFGQKTLKTPNLDAMAASGLRLTNHYSGSTVCAPSRCVLMTGLHTGHCTVRTNGNVRLRDDDVTVARVLKDAGYSTGCIGKWGVGRPGLSDPNDHGFDYFYGYVCMNHAHNCYPEFIVRNGEKVALRNVLEEKWRTRGVPEGAGVAEKKVDFVPHLCQQEVLQFIDKNKEDPFFLYYALNIPHANNEGGGQGMEVPSYGEFADQDWPDAEKGFAAMISYIDGYMKEIFDKLKETGLVNNTLVIFTSDNGPHQEGGHQMEFFDSNGELRGKKRDLYEGGVRVPTICKWPGVIEPGRESDHASSFQDVMPTFCELAGIDCPPTDGISFAPTLTSEGKQQQHEHLFWEFYEGGGKKAVLKGKWKGIRLNTFRNPDGPIELYDITADLSEQKNVADQHPEIVADMARIMAEEHVDRRP